MSGEREPLKLDDSTRAHCWHPTGHGSTNGLGTGGDDQMQCCWCGAVERHVWHIREEMLEGHGPHETRKIKTYHRDNVGACAERPGRRGDEGARDG